MLFDVHHQSMSQSGLTIMLFSQIHYMNPDVGGSEVHILGLHPESSTWGVIFWACTQNPRPGGSYSGPAPRILDLGGSYSGPAPRILDLGGHILGLHPES